MATERLALSVAWLLSLASIAGCSEAAFHCEEVGRKAGTAEQGPAGPRRCHLVEDACKAEAPSCFERLEAYCFRTYGADRHTFYCAPTPAECERLRRPRDEAGLRVESCQLKRARDAKL
jgi:hypothetical protein